MAEENKIWYAVGADTSGLNKDLERAKASFKGLTDTTQNEGAKMDNMMVKLAASVGVAFSVQQAYQFAKSVADVRGEFQLLEASFKVMLGSKAQTDQLMKEMIRSAAETPLQLTDIANGAKSLLAYGTAAEKVNDTLLMLGNVSTAMNIPLSEMVYLYGTTQVQGRLYTQDMRQFMGRGIPVVEELSKQLGVGKDKISDLVEAGKIGFPEIEKAFQSMTSQGGKFYNMMESQAKTIPGQISNLKDVFEAAMNDLGQESEGIISGTISGAKMVIENYEIIGKTIAGLVAVYGTYKAAIITIAALEKVVASSKTATLYLEMNRALGALTMGHKANAVAIGIETAAQKALNAAMKVNPYVLAATMVVGLASAFILMKDNTTSAERAQKSYDEQIKKTTEALEEHRQELEKNIQTATDMALTDVQRAAAINKLRKEYPDILAKYNLENLSLAEKLRLIKELNDAEGRKAIDANTNNVKTIDAQIAATQKRIKDLRSQDNINAGTSNEIAANEKRLKDLQKVRQLSMQNVESDNVNAWTANLKNLTDAQINAQLKERKRMMYELSKKKEGSVGEITGLGWFRSDEIKTQNAALEAEQSRRNAVVVQDKSFWEEQKKKAQETQDAMGQDKINTKEWIDQQKLIDAAESKLIARNTSKKSGKNTDKNKDKEPEDFTKQLLEQARKQQDALYEIEQQNIDLEEEGVNREIRQNKLNHDKKIEEYKRMREDELQKLQDIEQEKWTNAGKKGKTTVTAELPAASISNYAALIKNENDLFEKANKETWTKALSEYQSFKDKQQKINENYTNAEKIINASTEPTDVKTAKLAEAKSIRDKDLKSLTDDLMRTVGLIELMEGDGSELVQKKIKQVLPLFEDISKLSHTELGKVKKAISEIEFTPEQIAAIKEAGLSLEEFQKILDRVKKASSETTEEQDWKNLSETINKITSAADKLGNAMQRTSGLLGDIGTGISAAASAASSVAEMMKPDAKNEDFIYAGISGLADMYTMIASQIEANKKAQEEWNAKIEEAAQKARMARIELEAYKETNLFGVENPYAKLISGANQYTAAMTELNSINAKMGDGQVQTGTKKVVSGANVAKGAGAGAAIGAGIVGLFTLGIGIPLGAAIGAAIGGAVGAAATKTVPVFNSLKKQYGEIYNKDTFELNPKILEDYDKLDEATKKMVDNWDEVKNKAREAQEQMKQTFSDLAGSIGDDLSNSLIEAFTGGDTNGAIESFKGKMTDTIEAIIQKLIFAQYFEGMFKSLEEKMNASFGEAGDQSIIDDLLWFTTEYPKALEDYNAAMEAAQAELQKQGYDLFGQAARTGASKGITTASQDTVDELNGRFTAVQGHTYSINETLKGMAANSAAMLGHLANIDTHTFRLENIESFMNEVRAGINQINTKGINLKV